MVEKQSRVEHSRADSEKYSMKSLCYTVNQEKLASPSLTFTHQKRCLGLSHAQQQ